MDVGQAIELAREWVEVHGSQAPSFAVHTLWAH